MPFTNSSSLSISVRESLPASSAGMRSALTISGGRSRRYSPLVNLSAIGFQNGTPPPPCSMTTSVRSTCGRPKRRSGLSLPYLPIDSSNCICGKRPHG